MDTGTQDNLETTQKKTKSHRWRICPIGSHLVRTHPLHVPPNNKDPEGRITTRHQHCAKNPSHKDVLSFDEIQAITETHFAQFKPSLKPSALAKEFPHADKYDNEIYGWVEYWNDIFPSDDPLDPNLIKALIATESSFNEHIDEISKHPGAHGLMQVTDETLHILQDEKGELNDFLIPLTRDHLQNTSANICAGVRWLFRKRVTASARLRRQATWIETISEYKSYLSMVLAGEKTNERPMQHIEEYYEMLKGKEK